MKNSSNKKHTTIILYIINYAVFATLLSTVFFYSQMIGFYLFMICLGATLSIFVVDTVLITKWYDFLACTLPFSFSSLAVWGISDFMSYLMNYSNKKYYPLDEIYFLFIYLCTLAALSWSTTATIIKYKLHTTKKSPVRFAILPLTVTALLLITAGTVCFTDYHANLDYTILSLAILPICVLLNLILILLPIGKKNQKE